MKRAFLVIDIQNDFCEGGSLAVPGASEIIPIVNNLIKKFKASGGLIVATKDWHPQTHKSFASNSGGAVGEIGELNGLPQIWWPDHCVQNTAGSDFHPKLQKDYIDVIVYKGTNPEVDSYSSFFDNAKLEKTNLDVILKEKGINTIYIVGLATDYCVKFSALDGIDIGYDVYVVEDGCRGVNLSPDDSRNAIEEMKLKGAKIIKSSDIK